MQVAPIPPNEVERLEDPSRLEILDTVAEQSFDDVTRIASHVCGTPIALISLVDEGRQWFKSKVGLEAAETPRDVAFCSHAMLQDEVLVIEDSLEDERFHDNPLATAEPFVRFYAGAPLVTEDGFGLGTLCVIGHEPRKLSEVQIECLQGLARQVLRQFELRLIMNEMRRLDDLKNDFIATVNHELRTPLTSIRGALSLVNSGHVGAQPTGRVGNLLDVAERNSLHLLSLINDLLDMQKIEEGKLELSLETFDLSEVVGCALEMTEQYVADRDCRIDWQPPGVEAPVSADRAKIHQVIANLVSNAAKFSPDQAVIHVRLATPDGVARLSVADQGCGIPDSAKASVFEKFAQIDASDAKSVKGSGLGLAISRRLVEAHGGSIGFESREGEGSTFYFELPLAHHVALAR